jgi:hypothetical protein
LLATVQPSSDGQIRIALDTLWSGLMIEEGRRDRSGGIRISEIMQRLGFLRTTIWVEGKAVRGYKGRRIGQQPLAESDET